jgi:hypothetical protein
LHGLGGVELELGLGLVVIWSWVGWANKANGASRAAQRLEGISALLYACMMTERRRERDRQRQTDACTLTLLI